jgi:hypothetical protein
VTRARDRDEALFPMIASISRVFMNEQMHWTLQATCSECLSETTTPLVMGVPAQCSGCGLVIKIDPERTVFHRKEGTGYVAEPLRRFRWGLGVVRALPVAVGRRPPS